MVERPAPLTGSGAEQIRQIHEYLCYLADELNSSDLAEQILNDDCGTGVALRDQFKVMKNLIGGKNNE